MIANSRAKKLAMVPADLVTGPLQLLCAAVVLGSELRVRLATSVVVVARSIAGVLVYIPV